MSLFLTLSICLFLFKMYLFSLSLPLPLLLYLSISFYHSLSKYLSLHFSVNRTHIHRTLGYCGLLSRVLVLAASFIREDQGRTSNEYVNTISGFPSPMTSWQSNPITFYDLFSIFVSVLSSSLSLYSPTIALSKGAETKGRKGIWWLECWQMCSP